jgi:hypothetical protein
MNLDDPNLKFYHFSPKTSIMETIETLPLPKVEYYLKYTLHSLSRCSTLTAKPPFGEKYFAVEITDCFERTMLLLKV